MTEQSDTVKFKSNDLHSYLDEMSGKSVLVAGDIMLDRFVYGDVQRISPESPVPVLSVRREENMPGGAGNVLTNLAGLGIDRHILTVIGDDSDGEELKTLLQNSGVSSSEGVAIDPARPTTVKTRFLAEGQQLLRCDEEQSGPLSKDLESELMGKAHQIMPNVQVLVLSDYGKGVLTPELTQGLIKLAKEHHVPVLADPKGTNYKKYEGADIITPNRKELGEATGGLPTDNDKAVEQACEALIKSAGVSAIIATRSQDGMTVMGKDVHPLHIKTRALEIYDVSGAGDTVIATVAAMIAAGADVLEAAAMANIAAGIVVAKVGTAPIRREELAKTLRDADTDIAISAESQTPRVTERLREAPICNQDEAEEYVKRWKKRGLSVGFTNGCFDLLHAGHVLYLNAARAQCDRLVIGMNTDDSVRRLKGPERPVISEKARATVLAALGAVDMVVLFGESEEEQDRADRVLDRLRPDVLFKGSDYTADTILEAPTVLAYGGRVEIIPLTEGHSTTDTITRLSQKAG